MRRFSSTGVRPWLLIGVAAAVLAPLATLLVRLIVDPAPILGGDFALLQLRVSDIGGGHTPLVGSYQRFGWNQPGPAYLFLLAIPYRLFGASFTALQIGAIVLNGLALGGMLVIAYRRGGLALYLWTGAVLAVVVHAMGPAMLPSFWEPDISVLALLLLVFVTMDVASGRAWSIPIAVVLAALLTQGWATTAPLAGALLVWALVAFAFGWFARRAEAGDAAPDAGSAEPAPSREPWRWPALASVGALALLAIPPVLQQLTASEGNITLMARFFGESHAVLGLPDAYRVTSIQLGTRPPWAGFALPLRPFEALVDIGAAPAVPLILAVFAAALIFASLRRDPARALGFTVLVFIVAEIGALSRLIGALEVEVMQPTWAVGAATALAAGWCIYSPLGESIQRRVAPLLGAVLAIALAGFSVVGVIDAADGPPAPPSTTQTATRLAKRVAPIARAARGPVLVRSFSGWQGADAVTESIAPELLVLLLDRAGADVVVDHDLANRYGAFRAKPRRAVMEARITNASAPPTGDGWRVVATVDPLDAGQRADRDQLKAEIDARVAPGASVAERLRAIDADPELRSLNRRYEHLRDQPALSASVRTITPSS
jgi:hypothetical protein